MAKIQLTIKVSYLPNWGVKEGIRELIQNARDAEVEHHAPMTIDWYAGNGGTLRIENEGTTLETKALLLGHTSKLGNSSMIGKFGEGLKLGVLALVRAGHQVKIRNGSEVWTPTIERSEVFDENVLTFHIAGGRDEKSRVRVEIGNISKEEWLTMKEGFLFLRDPLPKEVVSSYHGSLLRGPKYKGRIYVKGIFVQHDPDLAFGYDLKDCELDRDRKMVESWNLRYYTRLILLESANQEPAIFDEFIAALNNITLETEGVDESSYISEELAAKVTTVFQTKYGANAVPVANLGESQDIEHLGKRGVIVSKPLGAVLAKSLGNVQSVKENLRRETVRAYAWGELTPEEQSSLTSGIALVNGAQPIFLAMVDVVDFRSPQMEGQFKDGRILVAKRVLSDEDQTLAVLVHEVAHREGGDGSKSHVAQIEEIWTGIVSNLRKALKKVTN